MTPTEPDARAPASPLACVGLVGSWGNAVITALDSVGVRVLVFERPPDVCERAPAEGHPHPPASGHGPSEVETSGPWDRLAEPDALFVTIGASLTPARGADTKALAAVARAIGQRLRVGQLVVFAGPVPSGTTRTVALPLLTATGRVPGRDFLLAYSTGLDERGRRFVGGIDAASTSAAAALLSRAGCEVVRVSSLETAEVCGAIGGLYQTVQRAVTNELRIVCDRMGIDIGGVSAVSGVPLELAPEAVSVPLLVWGARRWGASFRLLDVAAEINAAMPGYVIGKVADALNDAGKAVRGSKVAILGIAFTKGADDLHDSPSFELLDHLLKKGAQVSYNDPHIPSLPRMQHWPI